MESSGILVSPEDVAGAERYRRQKDTAVLSVVFGDFCSSTRLLEELGEVKYDQLRQQREAVIVSHVTRDSAGAVVKMMGDGFLAVFSEPSTAVDRSLHIQACLPHDPRFGLRIGIDMGQVARQREFGIVNDVFGRHVNRAARIEALAEVGSVLSSFVVYDSAVGWLRDTVRWAHRPAVLLRGFSEPMSLHQPTRIVADPILRQFVHGALERSLLDVPSDPYDDVVARLRRRVRSAGERRFAILWVDDHPRNNHALIQELMAIGVQVDVTTDTTKALQALGAAKYSAVLSDMGRPEGKTAGLALLGEMKARGTVVPLLVFTSAAAAAEFGNAATKAGARICTSGVVSLLRALESALAE